MVSVQHSCRYMIYCDPWLLLWHQWTFRRFYMVVVDKFLIPNKFTNPKNTFWVLHLDSQNYMILDGKLNITKIKSCPQWYRKSKGNEVKPNFLKFFETLSCNLSNEQSTVCIGLPNDILFQKVSEGFFSALCSPPHPLTGFIWGF